MLRRSPFKFNKMLAQLTYKYINRLIKDEGHVRKGQHED